MGDKNQTDKKRLRGLTNYALSISRFIKEYLGIEDDNLLRAKLSHASLEEMFPHLKKTSYSYVLDNPSEVYQGKVAIVVDCFGNYIPYKVKGLIEQLEERGIDYVIQEQDWGNGTPESWDVTERIDYDLSNLPTYQLVELMAIHKKAKEYESYRRVRNELIMRKDSKRGDHLSKQKVLRKSAKRFYNEED